MRWVPFVLSGEPCNVVCWLHASILCVYMCVICVVCVVCVRAVFDVGAQQWYVSVMCALARIITYALHMHYIMNVEWRYSVLALRVCMYLCARARLNAYLGILLYILLIVMCVDLLSVFFLGTLVYFSVKFWIFYYSRVWLFCCACFCACFLYTHVYRSIQQHIYVKHVGLPAIFE